MIRAWIKNSMIPERQRSFAYATSAKDLWDNIKEKYGQRNDILLSKLKKSISNFKQNNLSLTSYYSQLHNLMNELENMEPKNRCICDARYDVTETKERDRMIQFVNGLNDSYEVVKNQILLIDPLPSMSRAYGLILQIEQQRELGLNLEMNALNIMQKETSVSKKQWEKKKLDKKNLICEFCKKRGYGKDTCFKLHGTPDWFKEMTEKKTILKSNNVVHGGGISKEESHTGTVKDISLANMEIKDLIRCEVQKLIHSAPESPIAFSNMVFDYAGNSLSCHTEHNNINSTWILDNGASCHIGTQRDLFSNLSPVTHNLHVYLPDGSSCSPMFSGSVKITPRITLHNVYLIPNFTVNLISVSTLLNCNDLSLIFYPHVCVIQDLSSSEEVGKAHQKGNLYFLYSTIPPPKPAENQSRSSSVCFNSSFCNKTIWHQRMGHAFDDVMNHLDLGMKFNIKPCDTCHKAKQHRQPFFKSPVNAVNNFDLIHMDL